MVAVAPLKAAAVVVMQGGGGQRCRERLWQSGGAWLVLRLVNGASDVTPQFEGSAPVIMAHLPVTLYDCCAQADYHNGGVVAYALTDTADGHAYVNDVDAVAAS